MNESSGGAGSTATIDDTPGSDAAGGRWGAALTVAREALGEVAGLNPAFLSTPEKAQVLQDAVALESVLVELRLRVMAAADDVAAEHGGRDVAAWLATTSRCDGGEMRRDQRLAAALDARCGRVAAAMAAGRVNPAQARAITQCVDRLPAGLDAQVYVEAEEVLVAHADDYGPKQLRRIGRRILEVVAPEIAEAELARQLAAQERSAWEKTSLSIRSSGDGTTRVSARIPDAVAARLSGYLHAFTNPRNGDKLHQACHEAALEAALAEAQTAQRDADQAAATQPRWERPVWGMVR